jgi:phosphoribosylanthranilate isomerase
LKQRADNIARRAGGALSHPLLPKDVKALIADQVQLIVDIASAIEAMQGDK